MRVLARCALQEGREHVEPFGDEGVVDDQRQEQSGHVHALPRWARRGLAM
jgi:hypothetical protein